MPSIAPPRFSVSFELKRPVGNTKGSIRAVVTQGGNRVRFAIGCNRIEVIKWDAKKGRVKGYTQQSADANGRIAEVQQMVEMWFNQSDRGSLQELQSLITGKSLTGSGNSSEKENQLHGIEELVEAYIKDKTSSGKKPIGEKTVAGFRTIMRALMEFEKGTGITLTARSFLANTKQQATRARELESSISEWLATKHVIKGKNKARLGMIDNTRYRAIVRLSTILRWAEEQGLAGYGKLHTRLDSKKIEAFAIALDEADISTIEALDLEENSHLWHVRNLFLLGIRTGQRFSDWESINPKRGNEPYQIIKTKKTGGIAVIFHTDQVRAILKHYIKDGLPSIAHPNYNGKVNGWLKELGQLAGLTKSVDKVTSINDRDHVETVPFYSLICTHSARRTFITLCLLAGIPDNVILMRTGQKDSKILKTYDRATADAVAAILGIV